MGIWLRPPALPEWACSDSTLRVAISFQARQRSACFHAVETRAGMNTRMLHQEGDLSQSEGIAETLSIHGPRRKLCGSLMCALIQPQAVVTVIHPAPRALSTICVPTQHCMYYVGTLGKDSMVCSTLAPSTRYHFPHRGTATSTHASLPASRLS